MSWVWGMMLQKPNKKDGGDKVGEPYILGRNALGAVAGTALFYPCSGNDLA